MKFLVDPGVGTPPQFRSHPGRPPLLILREDNWDDYGFKGSYGLDLMTASGEVIPIGQVKFLETNRDQGRPNLPDSFTRLPSTFCSLGQAPSYYEKLTELLTESQARAAFAGLRDIAVHPTYQRRFLQHPGYHESLLREGSAARALEDARWIVEASRRREAVPVDRGPLYFNLDTQVGGGSFNIPFEFSHDLPAKSRINVLIGYNGCGKTQILANLAMVAHADLTERRKDATRLHGLLMPFDLQFGSVVAVSFSAFDTFRLPELNQAERDRLRKSGDVAGYVYCGLRRYTGSATDKDRLKTPGELINDLEVALKKISTTSRRRGLANALRPIYSEPSFTRAGADIDFFESGDWIEQFRRLSSGHQIVLHIAVLLVAHLEKRSLVLIDEPESHLHPPLLAALMSAISEILERNDSFAVVATHSPVVAQEVPSKQVRIVSRAGSETLIDTPRAQTFGENLGVLTREIFHLDNTNADYEGTLASLADRFPLEQIEERLGGLSAQAAAFIVQRQSRGRRA